MLLHRGFFLCVRVAIAANHSPLSLFSTGYAFQTTAAVPAGGAPGANNDITCYVNPQVERERRRERCFFLPIGVNFFALLFAVVLTPLW